MLAARAIHPVGSRPLVCGWSTEGFYAMEGVLPTARVLSCARDARGPPHGTRSHCGERRSFPWDGMWPVCLLRWYHSGSFELHVCPDALVWILLMCLHGSTGRDVRAVREIEMVTR